MSKTGRAQRDDRRAQAEGASVRTGRSVEGERSWWIGRASNPVVGAMRRRVGSTPISLRHVALLAAGAGGCRPAQEGLS